MFVDVHVHPFKYVEPEKILEEMDKGNVSYAVLLAIDCDEKDLNIAKVRKKIMKRISESMEYLVFIPNLYVSWENVKKEVEENYPKIKIGNSYVAELVKKYKRFIGFGSVDICKGRGYVKKKLEEIKNLNLRGIKVFPTLQFFNPAEDKGFREVLKFCEKNKKILSCHTGCDPSYFELPPFSKDANPIFLKEVLDVYQPTVILAHMGSYSRYYPGIWFEEALKIAKKYDNVFMDTAAVNSHLLSESKVKKIREKVGFEKILFGSDYPAVIFSDIYSEINLIVNNKLLKNEEKELILYQNAKELFNL